MRTQIKLKAFLLVITLGVFLGGAVNAEDSRKKIVFFTSDDLTHPSGTHEFEAGSILLKKSIENSQFKDEVDVVLVNNWPENAAVFEGADVIVHYQKGNRFHFSNEHSGFFDKLSDKGTSQIFIHYAVDPNPEAEKFIQKWTGGVYQDKNSKVQDVSTNPFWSLNSQLENHPINKGVKPYVIVDEWYLNIGFEKHLALGYDKPNKKEQVYGVMSGLHGDLMNGAKIKKNITSKLTNKSQLTVFWAKERENGARGVGVTGAHYHKNWANDNFRKQVLNAIVWAAHLEVPDTGVNSPSISEKEINQNLDGRRKGGVKKISLEAPDANGQKKNAKVKPKKTATPKPGLYDKTIEVESGKVHPYFELTNIDTIGGNVLKVSSMHIQGDDLFVTTFSPDRTNKKPDHAGKVLKVENVTEKGSELKSTELVTGLYEPASIYVLEDSLYVGTKTQILRFDNISTSNLPMKVEDAVVLVDGVSTVNFHTYTIGFEAYEKDGELYLCGNFTTAILLGGKRAVMSPPNPKVNRGSTFLLGPITGEETAESVDLTYISGGFRTPNGLEVGPDNEVYVADNQGVSNPSNELIRLEKGAFYGHYLLTENGRAAANQPKDIDPERAGSHGQSPATVHLPQGIVARSPAQPHVIHGRKGVLAPYNGQILLCEFTTGGMLRVFTEKVNGVWQGVVFKHSGGIADKQGNNGFTGGPNRIVDAADGNYYIGTIGAGRLWEFNGVQAGLQRLRVKSVDEVDPTFNEILEVHAVEGGFELEFLKPVDPGSIKAEDIPVQQWTYVPTANYGGAPAGAEKLKVNKLSFSPDGKKATLIINGLKDGGDEYVIKKGYYSSANTGYVVNIDFNPTVDGKALLYSSEFWYTLHKKIGGKTGDAISLSPEELAKLKYESLCVSCHVARGAVWAAPDLKGILGREQTVALRGGGEKKVKVNREYIINAIMDPESEKVLEYTNVFMAQMGIQREEAEVLADYIIGLK